MVLDIFALLVMLLLAAAGIALVVVLGTLPGKWAREVNHPQTDAINVLAWIGLFTGGIGWFVALVWSKHKTAEMLANASAVEPTVETGAQQ